MKIEPRILQHVDEDGHPVLDEDGRPVREKALPLVIVVCCKNHGAHIIASVFELGALGVGLACDVEAGDDVLTRRTRGPTSSTEDTIYDLAAIAAAPPAWCNQCQAWRTMPLFKLRAQADEARRSGRPRVVRL